MCVKEVMGKYDMWYGVVCKTDMPVMSSVFSLIREACKGCYDRHGETQGVDHCPEDRPY